MSQTFAAVRSGAAGKVHLGVSYDGGETFRLRCAGGSAERTDEPLSCNLCLTRYPGDLYLFRAGRTRVTVGDGARKPLSDFVTPIETGLTPVGHGGLSKDRAEELAARLGDLADARCRALLQLRLS